MPGSSLLLYVFAQAYIVFIVEEVWAFINSILIPGEGKRMNGLIIALGTVGSVTGGVVTGKLSMRIGSDHNILLAAVLTSAAALVGRAAFRLVRDQPPPRPTVSLSIISPGTCCAPSRRSDGWP